MLASLLLHVALVAAALRFGPHASEPRVVPVLIVDQMIAAGSEPQGTSTKAAPVIPAPTRGAEKVAPAAQSSNSATAAPQSALPVPKSAPRAALSLPGPALPLTHAAPPVARAAQPVDNVPHPVPVGSGIKASAPASASGEARAAAASGSSGLAKREGVQGQTRTAGGVTGTGSLAGNGSAAGAGSATAGRKRGEYQALLKRLIEARKEYPTASRRRGEQGSCRRSFVLARDGSVKQVETVSRCGHPYLDEAATRAITSTGKFPPFPLEIEGTEATFTVDITFTLSRQ